MQKHSRFRQWSTFLSIFALLISTVPLPVRAAPEDALLASNQSPLQSLVLPDETAQQVALRLEAQALKGGGKPGDYTFVWSHLGNSVEDPRLTEAINILEQRGFSVAGSLVTPEQMAGSVQAALEDASPLLGAFSVTLDSPRLAQSLRTYFSKLGRVTFWNHVQKWKRDDWDRTTITSRLTNAGFSILCATFASGWFLWSVSGKEGPFTQALGRAGESFLQSDTLSNVGLSALMGVKSLGNLSATSSTVAGLLFLWVCGYQTFFTAINSFRTQFTIPYFDANRPQGRQLVAGTEQAFSRLFFFLSSCGLEIVITSLILGVFNGGHVDLALAFQVSAYSAMAYMAPEMLAGTFNTRASVNKDLAEGRRSANNGVDDKISLALDSSASANNGMAWVIRNLFWNVAYGPIRNGTLLSVGGFLGKVLENGFLGLFVAGTSIDVYKSRSRLVRMGQNLLRRFIQSPNPAGCTDLIEVRALVSEPESTAK